MKKILLGVIGIGLVCLLGYVIRVATASDETRIRWLLEGMEEGFNDCRARAVVGGLSEEFEEDTARVTRTDLHQFLLYLFIKERDPTTKEFRFRVRLAEPVIEVVLPEAREATVEVRAEFLRLKRGGEGVWETVWEAEIDAGLRKEDDGWRLLRSTHRGVGGRRPF